MYPDDVLVLLPQRHPVLRLLCSPSLRRLLAFPSLKGVRYDKAQVCPFEYFTHTLFFLLCFQRSSLTKLWLWLVLVLWFDIYIYTYIDFFF